EIRRLAEGAIDSALAYNSWDLAIDAETFYRPVLDLLAENERLQAELRTTLAEQPEDFDRERLGRRAAFGLASFSPVVQGWARDLQSALSEIDRLREATENAMSAYAELAEVKAGN